MSSGRPLPHPVSVPWSFLAAPPEESQPEDCRVVVLPVPYDSTTSYMGGAREGPHAIIQASRHLEDYDVELRRETYLVGIHTLPELEPYVGGPEGMVDRVQAAVEPFARDGKLVAVLGGEHTVSVGAARAFRAVHPELSVLYLDAHADLRDEYMGSPFSHACAARRIWEECPVVEVGVRSISQEERDFVNREGVRVYFHDEGSSPATWDAEEIASHLSGQVYVSIDLDVLDPSIMAAVGTPEPGGMDWYQITALLKSVVDARQIVGFDLVELSPGEGPTACSYTAAKLAYKMMAYSLRLTRSLSSAIPSDSQDRQ